MEVGVESFRSRSCIRANVVVAPRVIQPRPVLFRSSLASLLSQRSSPHRLTVTPPAPLRER
jgi:hypothetical protein